MIDLHSHLLPGLDDGAATLDEALQMAEMAISDGITHMVATPHANGEYQFRPDLVRKLRDEIQERVAGRLQLATGCDFHLSPENLQAIRDDFLPYTINQKDYLLIEFDDFAIPPSIEGTLHQLQLVGLNLIITHPERNSLIRNQPDRFRKWLEQGCYVQVTAQSLLGRFGTRARRIAETWLERDCIHFFASDAHNVTSRPPQLRQAYEVVVERRGEAVARALFHDNPLAALEGSKLPHAPEFSDWEHRNALGGRRKRFIFF